MSIRNKIALGAVACVLGTVVAGVSTPARADDAGAFIGGVFATVLLSNMRRQTQAQEAQAAAAAQPRYVPSAPAPESAEQRIRELDKLAAGGYITPDEYKAKKEAILAGM